MKPIKVLILDGVVDRSGEAFSDTAFVEYPQSVIITKDFSDKMIDYIGKARLYRHGNEFYIDDINFYDDIDAELITKQAYLYPCVGGRKMTKEGDVVTHFSIDKIGLTLSPNTDERIESIRTQLEKYDDKRTN